MNSERLTVKELGRAALLIKNGKLVAFPTETVYGVGASLSNPQALEEIFRVKGRQRDNPLIVHICTLEQVEEIAQEIPPLFYHLADHFFPGPLTVVLKRRPSLPTLISAGLPTIAIRQPRHSIAQELIRLVGEPLAAPSANLSGRPSSTVADHVLQDLSGKIAAVIDGGRCSIGMESTVIDLVSFKLPTILRPGAISREEIREVVGGEVEFCPPGAQMASPGMKYRHYAPKASVRLFRDREELEGYLASAAPCKRALLSPYPIAEPMDQFPFASQSFYAHLRHADEEGYEEVLLLCDEQLQENAALMNRIAHMINA